MTPAQIAEAAAIAITGAAYRRHLLDDARERPSVACPSSGRPQGLIHAEAAVLGSCRPAVRLLSGATDGVVAKLVEQLRFDAPDELAVARASTDGIAQREIPGNPRPSLLAMDGGRGA
jgi:hypothetical protein